MTNRRFLELAFAGFLVLTGCAQQQLNPVPEPEGIISDDFSYQSNFPNTDLPGIDRSVFQETNNLSPLATPIDCKNEISGPIFREQTKDLKLNDYNLIQFDLNIGVAKYKAPYFPYAYTGGDVSNGDGALDAGVFADPNTTYQGAPMWMPFMNYSGGNDTTVASGNPQNFKYGLANNQKLSVKMWTSVPDYVIRMSVSGNFIEIDKTTKLPNPQNPNARYLTKNFYIYMKPPANTRWQKDAIVAYKLMITIAITTPGNYAYTVDSSPQDYPTSDFTYFDGSIKIGKINGKNTVSNLTDWNSLVLPSTNFRKNPCYAPNDVATNTGKHSAKIQLRSKAQFNLTPLPVLPLSGYESEFIGGVLNLKNTGLQKSVLYFDADATDAGGTKASGKLLITDKSQQIKYGITCSKGAQTTNKNVQIYYSEGDTVIPGSKQAQGYPSGTGNLLYKIYNTTIQFNCKGPKTKQAFQIPPTTLTALVNQSTPETTQKLTVISDSATVSGQYLVGPKAALAAQSIIVNADPVTPVIPTPFQTKDLLVTVKPIKCGPTAGTNAPLNSTISDPTGNTDPTDYAVTVRCVGPAISDPAPNPLNLSGTVGNPVTGTFTFQNVGEVVNGAQAPLTFSLSPSAGLTASAAPASPLAGGGTATVTVGALCAVAGTKTYTVTITSDDPLKKTVVETVVVTCTEPPPSGPSMSDPTPNPLYLEGKQGETVTGSFTFQNTVPNSVLNFSLSGSPELSLSGGSGSLSGGSAATITVNVKCDSVGTKSYTVTVSGNDPKKRTATITVNVNCLPGEPRASGPTPKPLEFGTLKGGQRVTGTVIVSNVGTGDLVIDHAGFEQYITISNISKTIMKPGESSAITLDYTCPGASYVNDTVKWNIENSTAVTTNDRFTGNLEIKYHLRCIPEPNNVPLVSYSTSAAAGLCDYGYYDALNNVTGQQACFNSVGGAQDWANSQLPIAVQYYTTECAKYECDLTVTGYGSGPPNGFGESITNWARRTYH